MRHVAGMGWLWLVELIKLYFSFAKEPYRRDNILQKRPIILSMLLTVATPYKDIDTSQINEACRRYKCDMPHRQ